MRNNIQQDRKQVEQNFSIFYVIYNWEIYKSYVQANIS